jgi:hypothetical protein
MLLKGRHDGEKEGGSGTGWRHAEEGGGAPTDGRWTTDSDPVVVGMGGAAGEDTGSDAWAPGGSLNQFKVVQTISNPNQTPSNLIQMKKDLLEVDIFEIKYGCAWFDVRNIFPYRNFCKFEMYFELKIRKASRVWIWENFSWNLKIWWNLGKVILFAPRWQLNSWRGFWSFKLGISWLGLKDLTWN